MMNVGIECVVDRVAFFRAALLVLIGDALAASIGKDNVKLLQRPAKRISGVAGYTLERTRRVHIPEDLANRSWERGDLGFQFLVENSDAACLDDYVAGLRPAKMPAYFVVVPCV